MNFQKFISRIKKELCIPHLYTDNKLCLYDTNEVLPNPERYREEALESVRRAKDLLVSSEKQENIIDYQIEAISFGMLRQLEKLIIWDLEIQIHIYCGVVNG